MLTTPDASDAVASCPPIAGPGPIPNGFFADCNPAAGFDGTRPIADYFNELILNLRTVLQKAGIAPVKGDATMLWRALLGANVITADVVFNVATNGTAAPTDPFAGDPFNSLAAALAFVSRFRIASTATVTIQIATGTYNATTRTDVFHPDGLHIHIQGAGQTATILNYTGASGGLFVGGQLGFVGELTVQGDGSTLPPPADVGRTSGIWIETGSYCGVGVLTVRGFGGHGIVIDGGRLATAAGTTLTLTQNHQMGLFALNSGSINASSSTLEATSNLVINVTLNSNSSAIFDIVHTTGGTQGLQVTTGAVFIARRLGVDVCSVPTWAVQVSDGALARARADAVAGDWWTWSVTANQPQNFYASNYGFINAGPAMAANNKANCSPAINTLGNVQAYILTT